MREKCPVPAGKVLQSALIAMLTILAVGYSVPAVGAAAGEIDDTAISDTVEIELSKDLAVPAFRLNVVTTEGIVTLSGAVDNLLAKERAAQIAMTVKGVRSVLNTIKVHPLVLRADRDIRRDIEDALLADPAADSYEIDVSVENGAATLAGSVDSWQERNLCETVAKGVKGVTGIHNKIDVKWTEVRRDCEIKADIEQALQWDAYVDHELIDVKVDDGVVNLSGIVGSAAEKRQARIDAYVNGVKEVNNEDLAVGRWNRDDDLRKTKYTQKSEGAIRKAVEDALLYDPRVSSFKIITQVSGSVVTLRGTVDNLMARQAAVRDARNTVGVSAVNNRIKVRPIVQLSSRTLEKNIEQALLRDPYVSGYQISVDMTGGVASLDGTVDTYFEKLQAEDIASKVRGAILVDNNLDVRQDYHPYVYNPYAEDRNPEDYDWYRPEYRYPKRSDAEIKNEIENELFWSPFVDSDDVTVTVDSGKATLTGTVDSWAEYHIAQENAYEGGAVYVDNEIIVTPR